MRDRQLMLATGTPAGTVMGMMMRRVLVSACGVVAAAGLLSGCGAADAVRDQAESMAVSTTARTVSALYQAASAAQGVPAGAPGFDNTDTLAEVWGLTSDTITIVEDSSGRGLVVSGFGSSCTVDFSTEVGGQNQVLCTGLLPAQ